MAASRHQNKSTLARRMSYLIVPGKYDSQALLKAIGKPAAKPAAHRRRRRAGGADERADQHRADGREGNTADIAIYDVRDKTASPCGGPRAGAGWWIAHQVA